VNIYLQIEGEQVHMEIVDDGVGFVLSKALCSDGDRRGWGLLGMQERAALLGGELVIESEPGCGTRLQVTLPWRKEDA